MKVVIVFIIMSVFLLWVRVLNLEDGMRKINNSVKLMSSVIMYLKTVGGIQ